MHFQWNPVPCLKENSHMRGKTGGTVPQSCSFCNLHFRLEKTKTHNRTKKRRGYVSVLPHSVNDASRRRSHPLAFTWNTGDFRWPPAFLAHVDVTFRHLFESCDADVVVYAKTPPSLGGKSLHHRLVNSVLSRSSLLLDGDQSLSGYRNLVRRNVKRDKVRRGGLFKLKA